MTIRSEEFDDIYFSSEDGMAETRHVFLAGNGLPERWHGRDFFTIAETGFGTGLNFLCAWDLFEKTAGEGQMLDYISFEKYPLSTEQIRNALSHWKGELGPKMEQMLAFYPLRIPGFHRIRLSKYVSLTLVFDDVNKALPQLVAPRGVDCWFLDGFAPAKNPEMWSDVLFDEMARLSAPQASAATFTVAGVVKRGLSNAGFAIEKKPGFGRKREMLCARFAGNGAVSPELSQVKTVAVIGGGLAGTACAYVLKQQGIEPVIYEASDTLASGASGNKIGLYNPRMAAGRSPENDFYNAAFAQVAGMFPLLKDIGFKKCGALHLCRNETLLKKYTAVMEKGGWHEDHMRFVNADEAAMIADISVSYDALFLPDSGYVSPESLCHAYAEGVDIRFNTVFTSFDDIAEDAAILACGAAVTQIKALSWLPLQPVRGQVTYLQPDSVLSGLKTNICYGGYVSPVAGDMQVTGATFQPWLDNCDVTEDDHLFNIENLQAALSLPVDAHPAVIEGRASLRISANDRFPVIGEMPDKKIWEEGLEHNKAGCYVSAAHGSHGIVSSLAGAVLLADKIQGRPYSLPRDSVNALSPERFLKRMKRKGAL